MLILLDQLIVRINDKDDSCIVGFLFFFFKPTNAEVIFIIVKSCFLYMVVEEIGLMLCNVKIGFGS